MLIVKKINVKHMLIIALSIVCGMIVNVNTQDSQDITEILKNFDILNNPVALSLIKDKIKKELLKNLRTGINTLKKEPEVYKDNNKVLIDDIEKNLNDFYFTENVEEEEKILKQILDDFRELVRTNDKFTEKERMENLINTVELVMKFLKEQMENLKEKLGDPADVIQKSKDFFDSNREGIKPGETNSTKLTEKNDSTDSNSNNKPSPPPQSFLFSPPMIVLFIVVAILIAIFVYCKYLKKRLRRNDIEYVNQTDQSTIRYPETY